MEPIKLTYTLLNHYHSVLKKFSATQIMVYRIRLERLSFGGGGCGGVGGGCGGVGGGYCGIASDGCCVCVCMIGCCGWCGIVIMGVGGCGIVMDGKWCGIVMVGKGCLIGI